MVKNGGFGRHFFWSLARVNLDIGVSALKLSPRGSEIP